MNSLSPPPPILLQHLFPLSFNPSVCSACLSVQPCLLLPARPYIMLSFSNFHLSVYFCPSIRPPVCLSVSVRQSLSLSVFLCLYLLPACLLLCQSVSLYVCPSVFSSICLSVCPYTSTSPSLSPSVSWPVLSVHLSACHSNR